VGGVCGTPGRGEKLYRVIVVKPEGKRPLGRQMRRWEDGIRMEIGWGVWIHLVQDRGRWRAILKAEMNLRVFTPRSYFV
jgi:hypothetical protein